MKASLNCAINKQPGQRTGPLTFASQTVGTQSGGPYAYLSNSGALPITVSKVAIAGTNPEDFQVIYNNCIGATLNQYCDVELTFTPRQRCP